MRELVILPQPPVQQTSQQASTFLRNGRIPIPIVQLIGIRLQIIHLPLVIVGIIDQLPIALPDHQTLTVLGEHGIMHFFSILDEGTDRTSLKVLL
jgi:hypothetical protein